MGCVASKDGVGTVRKSHSAQTGRSMSMPVQAQGSNDNGFHMVALTSSTYGILKTDSPKKDGKDNNSLSITNSAQDAFYQKLKNFDVPDEMVTKPWSEVSRNLLQVPPVTRTDSPRRMDSRRRLDSPRQARGLDSPRQVGSFRGADSPRLRGSFRRTDSPRRLPSQAAKNDHNTINTWDLMDGLEEDGTPKPKLKPAERIPRSPVIKPFESSISFSTIHTLSELDSGDPSQALTTGPANVVSNNSMSGDVDGRENPRRSRAMSRSMSSPVVPKRDEITVRLTPSSPAPRSAVPNNGPSRPLKQSVSPMMPTPEENALIQEVSKVLLAPPSPALRAAVRSSNPPLPLKSSASPMIPTLEANSTTQAVSKALFPPSSPKQRVGVPSTDPPRSRLPSATPTSPTLEAKATAEEVSKALLPPPLPAHRVTVRSGAPPRPRQSSVSPMMLSPEPNAKIQEVSKSLLPPPSPSVTTSAGTKDASVVPVRNRPPGLQPSKSTVVKAMNPPMSLSTKLEAEIERAMSEEQGGSKSWGQSSARRSLEPDLGRVRAVATSLSREGAAGARPQSTPSWVNAKETSSQTINRQIPRFASPIHVLSLAASFDLENRKNSMPHLDLKASPATMKTGGGRPSFSKQQSMPSPVLRAIPSSGQGVGLHSQISAPSHGRHWSLDASANARVAPILERGTGPHAKSSLRGTAMDSDLMSSFEEALEMFSADDWYSVRDSKSETRAVPGEAEKNGMILRNGLEEGVSDGKGRQVKDNKRANTIWSGQGEPFAPASKGVNVQKLVKPDPWARFEKKCPPAGEDRVVLYTTSLRGIRKTFEDCNNARFILQSFSVEIDERDVSIHAEFRQELKELSEILVPVPQAFIKGRYIGGMDMITKLHEDGTLSTLVGDLPPQLSRGECDGCGGVRFVPCSDCSGSTKIVNEAKEVVRCIECNENGLMRCPICY